MNTPGKDAMADSRCGNFVVGITGASGALYSGRLVASLAAGGHMVHVVISPHGRRLFADELDVRHITPEVLAPEHPERVILYPYNDVGSRLASGSFLTDGMVVIPCSGNTLGGIASGIGDNLILRAAAVTLKEGRRLILVPREMPLSIIELENMLRAARAGAVICPACPGFYMKPARVEDLVDFVVGKVLDLLGVPHDLNTRWETQQQRNRSQARVRE